MAARHPSVPDPAQPRTDKRERLRQGLLSLIAQQSPGSRLPTERELSERFEVARETLRHCLRELEEEGVLHRRQGAGTFVTTQPVVKEARLMSFSEEMRQRGLQPSSRLLSFRTLQAGAKLAQRLMVMPGSAVLEVRRLRLANQEPMALETSCFAAERVPGFDPASLEQGSLYELLERQYGLQLRGARQQIQATVLSREEAELLAVPPFFPALLIERTSTSTTGEVIEYAKSLYRADRYRFEISVSR
ncbi:GntR family transcriptional regulator [Pelomonas sp. KK5]|uniref:GntR family transcriptional regulator n=1 Tax=Pelomonas sp. KK5 TaxID=1855730 RepID=UPI0009F9DF6E|nr:GntR family transcriptional regulator [Pelomonas sp. KK5]